MAYAAPRRVLFQGGKLRNGAYGFPRTEPRRVKPFVLLCMHISGNLRTARNGVTPDPGDGTYDEVLYMARDRNFDSPNPDWGNSAHSYVARNGAYIDCVPTKYATWNNGDLQKPNTAIPGISKVVALAAKGFNANEAYVREIECTGHPTGYDVTPEQRETAAYFLAWDSIKWGLSISRGTFHTHADIDSVDRQNCAFPARRREELMAGIITRAKEIKKLLEEPEAVLMSTIDFKPYEVATVKDDAPLFDVVGGAAVGTIDPPLERPTFGTSPDGNHRLIAADFKSDDKVFDRTIWIRSVDVDKVAVVEPLPCPECPPGDCVECEAQRDAALALAESRRAAMDVAAAALAEVTA